MTCARRLAAILSDPAEAEGPCGLLGGAVALVASFAGIGNPGVSAALVAAGCARGLIHVLLASEGVGACASPSLWADEEDASSWSHLLILRRAEAAVALCGLLDACPAAGDSVAASLARNPAALERLLSPLGGGSSYGARCASRLARLAASAGEAAAAEVARVAADLLLPHRLGAAVEGQATAPVLAAACEVLAAPSVAARAPPGLVASLVGIVVGRAQESSATLAATAALAVLAAEREELRLEVARAAVAALKVGEALRGRPSGGGGGTEGGSEGVLLAMPVTPIGLRAAVTRTAALVKILASVDGMPQASALAAGTHPVAFLAPERLSCVPRLSQSNLLACLPPLRK